MDALGPWQWIGLVGAAAHLMLALLVVTRGGRGPAVMPLALLCLDFFAWNFATVAFQMSGDRVWHVLDMVFSPFAPPLALSLVLAFVGRARQLQWLLVLSFVGFGLLSMVAALGFAVPEAYAWSATGPWGTCYVVALLSLMAFCVGLLVLHVREALIPSEKARGRLILAAVLVGSALGSTEFWDELVDLPNLGALGSLGATGLLTIAVLRFRLFGRDLSVSTALYMTVLAGLGLGAYLVVFEYFATSTAAFVVGGTIVTIALGVAVRDVVVAAVVRRERRQQFEGLGRLAAQMAHDLKNPLAALKGAVEYLLEERAQGRSIDGQGEFLELLAQQIRRLGGVIEAYQRLSRLEPVRVELDLNELVRDVLSLQAFTGHRSVRVETALAEALPRCRVDPDLLGSALENLVRNAVEAMPNGGTLRVSTSGEALSSGGAGVALSVGDTGIGMDARQRVLAFDSFFTTKPDGTGLGLAQVRRVVEAHQGELLLTSQAGHGTTVRLKLPVDPSANTEAS